MSDEPGVEDIKGKTLPGDQPPKPRRTLSKAELREQAEAAFLSLAQKPIQRQVELRYFNVTKKHKHITLVAPSLEIWNGL